MKRSVIGIGDKTTANGVVIEGVLTGFNQGTPLAYHGAKIACPACKSEGYIAAWGPRWSMAYDGKQIALENDLCICGCEPPPRLIASHDTMFQSFESDQLTTLGFASDGSRLERAANRDDAGFDRHFRFVDDRGQPVTGIRVHLTGADGTVAPVITDADGRTPIVSGSEGQEITVQLRKGDTQ